MPKTSDPSGYIDPLELARFLVLPRVPELLQAFASIPPGRLRDTIIEHAQALAEAHNAAPAQHRYPDPLPAALGHAERPKALPRRTEAEPPTQGDPKATAVKLRLDGKLPYEIAKATGLSVHAVYGATAEARKAGVKFPPTPRAKAGLGAQIASFAMTVDQIGERQMGVYAGAARRRGTSLEAYMHRRKTAVEMAIAGQHVQVIMDVVKESKDVLTSWFSLARSAGLAVPYMIDALPAQFEDAPKVVDLKAARQARKKKPSDSHRTFVVNEAEVSGKGRALVDRAAASLGLTRAGYFELRRAALHHFRNGKPSAEVARLLKLSPKQAQNWRERATNAGLLAKQA